MTGPTLRVVAGWLLIAALGTAAAWWQEENRRAALQQQMIGRAQYCAVAFVTDDVAALTGTSADLNHPEYRAVKDRLLRLRAVSPGIRFVYLFRSTAQPGHVVFLADSEPETSSEMSKPGDDYPEALSSPGLQAALRTHAPATEGRCATRSASGSRPTRPSASARRPARRARSWASTSIPPTGAASCGPRAAPAWAWCCWCSACPTAPGSTGAASASTRARSSASPPRSSRATPPSSSRIPSA
ncbi:hypothetical protein [Oleiharenicola sp. Vm1]|uniref:hypothetical protein n=1 Tax=Oleiharenicola sp. Vm1 TaxID=3398393 RepID=UPI0039F5AEE5